LNEVGGKELVADYEGIAFPIADMDDPINLQRHLDFIKRLGERYEGHPDIAHVDIGSIGWWGEWHLSGSQKNKLPTIEHRTKGSMPILPPSRRRALDADRWRSVPQVRGKAWGGLACRLPR
jgi:hypothetical protein